MKRLMLERTLTTGAMLGAVILAAGTFVPARAGELIDAQFPDANAPAIYRGKSFVKAQSSNAQIAILFTNYVGHFAVYLSSGENSCGGNGYWGTDATTPGGKALMSQLLTAKGMGKRVQLYCTGTWNGWNSINAVYMVD